MTGIRKAASPQVGTNPSQTSPTTNDASIGSTTNGRTVSKTPSNIALPAGTPSHKTHRTAYAVLAGLLVGGAFAVYCMKNRSEQASPVESDTTPSADCPDQTFVVGESNPSCAIRSLQALNGIPIEELEQKMRSGFKFDPNDFFDGSSAGFMGEKERLLDLLVNDNDLVLRQNLTHAALAEPLFLADRSGGTFTFRGQYFYVTAKCTKGLQHSPFRDGTAGRCDYTVKKWFLGLIPGNTISFSQLHIPMIEHYGFYEGKGTAYRVEPQQIIDFFGMR